MNRKVTLLYISLACVLSLQAQTRQQMGGVYYAYPEGPSAKTGTFGTATYVMSDSLSVPQGYAPFYISHYGRHGSRKSAENFGEILMRPSSNKRPTWRCRQRLDFLRTGSHFIR